MQNISETSVVKSVALERLSWTRGFAERILAGVPDEALTHRAGGRGNHALWVMGHLAWTDDDILAMLTGCAREMSPRDIARFKGGSEPSASAADYPSRDELLTAMRLHRRRFETWVQSLDSESMRAPTPQGFRPFAPDAITTAFGVAAHEMLHAGQVVAVRASLGLPRLLN